MDQCALSPGAQASGFEVLVSRASGYEGLVAWASVFCFAGAWASLIGVLVYDSMCSEFRFMVECVLSLIAWAIGF